MLASAGLLVGAHVERAAAEPPRINDRKLLWEGTVPAKPQSAIRPLKEARRALVPFATAPFPYEGVIPKSEQPFLETFDNGRRGRVLRTAEIRWQDDTYADDRVLVHIPQGFDANRPLLIVLFLHGNGATLERDVEARQRVPDQVARAGLNTVLLAPQLAVDAPDSSAGKFWQPGALKRFLDEAAKTLAAVHGHPRTASAFAKAPVLIVAYSGGYLPTASLIKHGGAAGRIHGIVILDGLYGEQEAYADWITTRRRPFFVSAYGPSSQAGNKDLADRLAKQGLKPSDKLDRTLGPGRIVLLDAGARSQHAHFVTEAWSKDPITDLLRRIPGFPRRSSR